MAYKDIMKSENKSDLKNSLKKRSGYHKTRQYGLSPFCSLGEGLKKGEKIYFDGMKLIDIYKTIRRATFDAEPGDSLAVKYKDTSYGGSRECRMTQSFTPGQWKYMEGKHRGWYTTENACMFLSYTARDHRDSYLEVLGNEDVNLTEQDATDKSFEKQKRKNTREAERIYGDISQRPLIYVYSPRHSELPQSTFAVCILMKYILVDVDDNGSYSFNGETCISSYDSFNDRAARNSVVKLASMSNSPTAVIGVATPWILYYEGDKVEARELKEYDTDNAFAELVYSKGDTNGMNKFKEWCDANLNKEITLDNIETEIRRKFKVKKRSKLKAEKLTESVDFNFTKETMYKVEKFLYDNPDTRYLVGELDMPNDKTFGILIERGDWKHEHNYLEDVVMEYLYSLGIKATHITKEVGHSQSDNYSAWHYFILHSDSKNNSKLTEAPDMFGYMTDDEMDADDQARRDRLEKELADRRARTVDKRNQWQQHKPTYDEAVKRFQNSAGKVLEQLAHKFESGKLLQWSAYETPLVEIYKQHGSDYIVFKPIGDNKKNWLDTIVYSLSTGKVHFNYYKDDIGRYLDAYDQVAKLVDSCASVVSGWVDFIEDQNKQSTDKAINSFLGDFVDNPSNIDCAFDCSDPGHYLHGCRFYIFSVDGKVYHYEDYDSGAYTNNHVHQISCFDRIDIKKYVWYYDNPVLEKIDPSRVGLSVKGDLYGSQYLLGGVVRLADLTSGRGTPTDKVVRLGYYTSPDNVRHSVYFYSNERDTTKAQSQLAKLVPQGSVQVGVARQTSETDAKKKGFTLIESSRRKKRKGIYINKNAGNVEHNINMFNMANSPVGGPCNNPISGPMGGNVCCESIEPMSQDEYENFLKENAVECYRGFDILHSTWHIKSGEGKEDVWDSYAFILNGKFFPDEVYDGLDSIEKTRERIDQIIRENPGRFGALEYDRDAATKFEKEFDVMSPQEVADNFGREVKDGDDVYSPKKKYEGLDDDFDMFMRGV